MPEDRELEIRISATPKSRKLTITVITMAALPVILPLPLYFFYLTWFHPLIQGQLRQCGAAFSCPPAEYWDRLGGILLFGPEIIVAVISLFFGFIGLAYSYSRPTSPGNRTLFRIGVACGLVWVVLFGCALIWYLAIPVGHS